MSSNRKSESPLRPADIKGFIPVETALTLYLKRLRQINGEIYKPQHQNLRELFQAVMLTLGVSILQQKRWFIRLVENDAMDFEAMAWNTEDKIFDTAKIQNMMIPEQCREKTDEFSEEGIAKFIYETKLKRAVRGDYSSEYIFGVFMKFRKSELN